MLLNLGADVALWSNVRIFRAAESTSTHFFSVHRPLLPSPPEHLSWSALTSHRCFRWLGKIVRIFQPLTGISSHLRAKLRVFREVNALPWNSSTSAIVSRETAPWESNLFGKRFLPQIPSLTVSSLFWSIFSMEKEIWAAYLAWVGQLCRSR